MPQDAQESSSGPGSPSCTPAPPDALPSELNTPTSPDRRGPAPRNEGGQIVCTWPECAGVTFIRRSDWTKHMDKHERPYKCQDQRCKHFPGFTYGGGLLRHEREVHGKHGGPHVFYCQEKKCKRSTGRGFTRRENVVEHMHRMHNVDDGAVDPDVGSSTVRKPHERTRSEDSGVDVALTPPACGKAIVTQMDSIIQSAAVADGGNDGTIANDSLDNHSSIRMLYRENEQLRSQIRERDESIKNLSFVLASIIQSQLEQ